MSKDIPIPIGSKLFKNLDEDALTSSVAAQENCFITEAGGISRFPGLKLFADIGGKAEVYLDEFANDMIAVTSEGKTYRIDQQALIESVPGPAVLGGRRTTFANLKDRLIMAAGSQIIAFDGKKNEVLSPDAPLSTHIGTIDTFVLGVEVETDRFFHSSAGDPFTWKPSDVFAAGAQPDDISALIVTRFNEVLACGDKSIEQYERLSSGDTPFFRRWSIGEGISEPYTLSLADNAAWALNDKYEFIRLSGQTGDSYSDDIGRYLKQIYSVGYLQSKRRAWSASMNILGQKFMILQSPEAINSYGTKGVTLALDIRQKKWLELYGWDEAQSLPVIWPGRSVYEIWGRVFVGGEGKIYEVSNDLNNHNGQIQRLFVRTAHLADQGRISINSLRMTVKRGIGSNTVEPVIAIRVNRDGSGFGRWQTKGLGRAGQRDFIVNFPNQGIADTWQFEIMVTDDCPVEIRNIYANITSMRR